MRKEKREIGNEDPIHKLRAIGDEDENGHNNDNDNQ
jgi:hypothetical protein